MVSWLGEDLWVSVFLEFGLCGGISSIVVIRFSLFIATSFCHIHSCLAVNSCTQVFFLVQVFLTSLPFPPFIVLLGGEVVYDSARILVAGINNYILAAPVRKD